MVRLKKGGREMTVIENDVEKYMADGWKVINRHGEEIEYVKPMSYDTAIRRIKELEAYQKGLQESLNDANAKIKALEAENRKLKKAAKQGE